MDAARRRGVKIECSELPCLAHFGFKEMGLERKTLYTVLVLREGFMSNVGMNPTMAHNEEILALHQDALDKMFLQNPTGSWNGYCAERQWLSRLHAEFRRLIKLTFC